MIFLFFGTSLALLEAELQHFKEIGDGLVARERQRLPKNLILGQKHKFFKNPKKLLGPKQKYFQTATDKISSEQLTKLQKIKPFGHSKAPKKKKFMTDIAHFPRPGQNYPYTVKYFVCILYTVKSSGATLKKCHLSTLIKQVGWTKQRPLSHSSLPATSLHCT